MLKKITFLVKYNRYEASRYFTARLSDALKKQGIEITIIDAENITKESDFSLLSDPSRTDLTCSFNPILPMSDGSYFWEKTGIPHLFLMIDPVFYSSRMMPSKNFILGNVDRFECEIAKSYGASHLFFFPHGADPALAVPDDQPRPYDVLFCGSCYDHETARRDYQMRFDKTTCKIIDEAIEIVLSDHSTPVFYALKKSLESNGKEPSLENIDSLYLLVDTSIRGIDRVNVIRSIKDVNVHLFGSSVWGTDEVKTKGWSELLGGQQNVMIHPRVLFSEALELMKQSKFVINSMPFFKNGSHERILNGFLCGALPVTSDNLWVRENFTDGKEILAYQPKLWSDINGKILDLLGDEAKRKTMVSHGKEKVLKEHTWDRRAKDLLRNVRELMVELL